MKKTSLLVAVPTLALSVLLLAGCGLFRSHKAWDKAVQESPLEIPPGLDTPSATAALNIPAPGANLPNANGARAMVGSVNGQIADGFIAAGSVDGNYQKVGKVLQDEKLGRLVSHDDAAHSYVVAVSGTTGKKRGAFGRMFHRHHRDDASASGGAAPQVTVTVGSGGTSGTEIRATGAAAAVDKVIDALKDQLGK